MTCLYVFNHRVSTFTEFCVLAINAFNTQAEVLALAKRVLHRKEKSWLLRLLNCVC